MEGRGCDGHEEGIEGVDLGCNILSDFDLFYSNHFTLATHDVLFGGCPLLLYTFCG